MNRTDKKFIRRKRYFVKKSFQTELFIGFVLLLFFQALIIAGLFITLSNQTITSGYQGSRFVVDKTSNFFLLDFIFISLVVGISIGIVGILIFIFLSHRIAGPLYKFEKVLHSVTAGDFATRIRLRKADQLKELQTVLNEALLSTDNHLKEIKKELTEAEGLLLRSDREKHLDKLKSVMGRLKEKIAFFKTS